MKELRLLATIFAFLLFCACSGNTASSIYVDTNHIAIDSNNNRLFLVQSGGEIIVQQASDLSNIGGGQPLVSEEKDEEAQEDGETTVFSLMPYSVRHFSVYPTSTTSRLFVMGDFTVGTSTVFNRIRVLDFEATGNTFSEASFSQIEISDNNAATDETDNSFADMLLDVSAGNLYITDATASLLYVYSATDGTQVTSPISIAGIPQSMALADGNLYVCNSSSTESEQVITVVDTSDFTTSSLDIGAPCTDVAVSNNGQITLMMTKHAEEQTVFIQEINTSSFTALGVSASASLAASGFSSGSISAAAGLSSGVTALHLAQDTSDVFYGYVPDATGDIQIVTVTSNGSEYSLETVDSDVYGIVDTGQYTDTSSGSSVTKVFMVSTTGTLISVDVGSTSLDIDS